MKKDIVIAGVGGQGILSISVVLINTALSKGLKFRQSEIHGMSQRGGPVETHVRISDMEVYGSLIAQGRADMIISIEPLEALRHINYLAKDGVIITSNVPYENIDNYPPLENIHKMLIDSGRTVYIVDSAAAALESGNPKTQNTVLIGAASKFLPEFTKDDFENSLKEIFKAKGESVVLANLKAFELGSKILEKLA